MSPRPVLSVRRVDTHRWLFLGYPDGYEHFDQRWHIESRPDMEGLWLVNDFPWTAERGMAMIAEEITIAEQAFDEIRRQCAA